MYTISCDLILTEAVECSNKRKEKITQCNSISSKNQKLRNLICVSWFLVTQYTLTHTLMHIAVVGYKWEALIRVMIMGQGAGTQSLLQIYMEVYKCKRKCLQVVCIYSFIHSLPHASFPCFQYSAFHTAVDLATLVTNALRIWKTTQGMLELFMCSCRGYLSNDTCNKRLRLAFKCSGQSLSNIILHSWLFKWLNVCQVRQYMLIQVTLSVLAL